MRAKTSFMVDGGIVAVVIVVDSFSEHSSSLSGPAFICAILGNSFFFPTKNCESGIPQRVTRTKIWSPCWAASIAYA